MAYGCIYAVVALNTVEREVSDPRDQRAKIPDWGNIL